MKISDKTSNRRTFIKTSAMAGGGLVLSFNWLTSCKRDHEKSDILELPENWIDFNAYLKIGDNGVVTIYSPNPEFGQNIKTAMPMIVAEELDVDWKKVIVEQAPYNQDKYPGGAFGQFTGGSRGIMMKWKPLRTAGATAKQMLKAAAAQTWNVSIDEISTSLGTLHHKKSGQKSDYGAMATLAATLPVPETVTYKKPENYKIIGHSKKNVEAKNIVTGKPMFGIDYQVEGMKYAMPVFPPAFGLGFESISNLEEIKSM
ncbi:MAG: xanthine dehydrogenase family protein molybdopterin-binding subunit, partial [Saprospiraceae bacterium]|nr:xanthine dehydrogenase family protein molybdopterin-binding subunit [Saprospiraceae bacterium]